MRRVFEAGDIQDEHHILCGVVATDWGEMPGPGLQHLDMARFSLYSYIFMPWTSNSNNPPTVISCLCELLIRSEPNVYNGGKRHILLPLVIFI